MSQDSAEVRDLGGGIGDSTSSTTATAKNAKARRGARVIITPGNDLIILTGVLGTNPYEDSDRWKDVAKYVSSMVPKRFSARNVKERVDYLLKLFPTGTSRKRKMGTAEEYLKRNQLLLKVKKLKDSFSQKKTIISNVSSEEFQVIQVACTAALTPRSHQAHDPPVPLLGLPTNSNSPASVNEAYQKEAATDKSSENIPSTAVTDEAEEMKYTSSILRTTLTSQDPPKPLPSKIPKISQGIQACCSPGASEKLDDTSNYAAPTPRDDSYDYFGKYITSMLHSIGPPTAMRLQEQITLLVTQAMCPPE